MKRVFSSFDRVAVYHARNLLQAEGIAAQVRNEVLGSAMGQLPPSECQIELWVLDDAEAERAERLLRHGVQRAAGAGPWRCSACGEAGEPQFTQCWRCGAYRNA